LRQIFSFYSKLQPPGQQLSKRALLYDEINGCNSTMSFFETLWFCRNFRVVPTFLSKAELLSLWRTCAVDRQIHASLNAQHLARSGLAFDDFACFLGRIAVGVYSKAAMQQLLARTRATTYRTELRTSTVLPSPSCRRAGHEERPHTAHPNSDNDATHITHVHMFEALAEYLRLHDIQHARRVIRTTGRETIAKLNCRSAGERDKHASASLAAERDAGRVTQLLKSRDGAVVESLLRSTLGNKGSDRRKREVAPNNPRSSRMCDTHPSSSTRVKYAHKMGSVSASARAVCAAHICSHRSSALYCPGDGGAGVAV
jgi:hypothetical protein